MARKPTDDELRAIHDRLVGPVPGLFVPVQVGHAATEEPATGPQFLIAATVYEGDPAAAAQALWNEIQCHEVLQLLTLFSGINLMIAKAPFGGPIHDWLECRCFTEEQRKTLLRSDPSPLQHRPQLFQRVGNLIAMKAFLSCVPSSSLEKPRATWLEIGNAAMAANVFVTGKQYRDGEGKSEDDRLMMEQLASWEVSNGRDLAYSIGRAAIILKKYLRSPDPEIVDACRVLSVDPMNVYVADIPLDEYIAIVTGLYSGLNILRPDEILEGTKGFKFNVDDFFSRMTIPRDHFDTFLRNRARTVDEFRSDVAGQGFQQPDELRQALVTDQYIGDFRAFRRTPFVVTDEKIIVPIDIQFIAELLAVGVYWALFDSFLSKYRERFAQLWGRMFHLYAADLMRFNYPDGMANVLTFETPFKGGAADALLDFGSDVVVFEFKGSLLTHAAKANRSFEEFEKDFRNKFVEKSTGERKGIAQLAAAAIAIDEQRLKTVMCPNVIYPVLVCYEAAMESFWVNKYANRIFRPLVAGHDRVQPLTIMSIEELESLLPHMIRDGLTWPEILRLRFKNGEVVPQSVHQVLYDWSRARELPPSRNEFLLKAYSETFDESLALFKDDTAE